MQTLEPNKKNHISSHAAYSASEKKKELCHELSLCWTA